MPLDMDDQTLLSEHLQLLGLLNYPDGELLDAREAKWTKGQNTTCAKVRMLDTIVLALTTGKPGEVFAAAFDDRTPGMLQVVLAKNDQVTPGDQEAANHLFDLICTSEDASKVLPFLFSRCWENIEKRKDGRSLGGILA